MKRAFRLALVLGSFAALGLCQCSSEDPDAPAHPGSGDAGSTPPDASRQSDARTHDETDAADAATPAIPDAHEADADDGATPDAHEADADDGAIYDASTLDAGDSIVADATASSGDASAGSTDADAGTASDASDASDASTVTPFDPFVIDTTRPATTFAALAARFPAGATQVTVGSFSLTGRARASCNAITGCAPWVTPSPVTLSSLANPYNESHTPPSGGSSLLMLDPSAQPPVISLRLSAPEPGAPDTILITCAGVLQTSPASAANMICTMASNVKGLLWFEGHADSGSVLRLSGRIDADGAYQFVSQLGSSMSGATPFESNDLNQIAIYGTL